MEVLARVLQHIPPDTPVDLCPGPDRNMILGTVLHDMVLLIELREAIKFQKKKKKRRKNVKAADAEIQSHAIEGTRNCKRVAWAPDCPHLTEITSPSPPKHYKHLLILGFSP